MHISYIEIFKNIYTHCLPFLSYLEVMLWEGDVSLSVCATTPISFCTVCYHYVESSLLILSTDIECSLLSPLSIKSYVISTIVISIFICDITWTLDAHPISYSHAPESKQRCTLLINFTISKYLSYLPVQLYHITTTLYHLNFGHISSHYFAVERNWHLSTIHIFFNCVIMITKILAHMGVEPMTFALLARRSNQLS